MVVVQPEVACSRLHHQHPLVVGVRIRLGQMPDRIALLRLHPRRIGIRNPDPELVAALGRPAHVLEVPPVKGLEPPMDHPSPHGGATLLDDDAGALFHGADAPQEEAAIRELRLEDGALESGNRDE